jgi:uncharacterized SAM-binding protein YcdF (DUF218 family)
MDFVLSKLLWPLATPSNWLAILIFLCAVGTWAGKRRLAGFVATLAVVAYLPFLAVPIGSWAYAPLENRFPAKDLPAAVDGIVVLGGSFNTDLTAARGAPQVNETSERLFALLSLARRYPEAKILFTGGEAAVQPIGSTEADAARRLFAEIGFDPARVMFEGQSRNTWENAVYSKRLADPKETQTWLLVTSADHMPRAVGCFRRAGFPVLPVPVDYRTRATRAEPLSVQFGANLKQFDAAAREWTGLLAYRLLGRTDAFFPAP